MALTQQMFLVFITKSGGSPIAIASTISVPADATLNLIDKNNHSI
jgi:hypothetical protein